MGTVHQLLEAKGRQATLQLDFDRQVVEAASAYMSDEDNSIGFLLLGLVPSRSTTSQTA